METIEKFSHRRSRRRSCTSLQNSSFLMQHSSFLIHNFSFLRHNSSFLLHKSCLLLTGGDLCCQCCLVGGPSRVTTKDEANLRGVRGEGTIGSQEGPSGLRGRVSEEVAVNSRQNILLLGPNSVKTIGQIQPFSIRNHL